MAVSKRQFTTWMQTKGFREACTEKRGFRRYSNGSQSLYLSTRGFRILLGNVGGNPTVIKPKDLGCVG